MLNEKKFKASYFLNLSFLGMNFFGVTPSKDGETLIALLENYFFEDFSDVIWIWPGSRLDSGVSATDLWLEIILKSNIEYEIEEKLLPKLLVQIKNFSHPEVKIHKLIKNNTQKNLIANLDSKTYRYFIYIGKEKILEDQYPLVSFRETFDLTDWKNWIQLYLGKHSFKSFSIRTKENAQFFREITHADIYLLSEVNNQKNLKFLNLDQFKPESIVVVEIKGSGFLRGQVRMMVGALLKLSKNEISQELFKKALQGLVQEKVGFKVPSYGLVLWESHFKNQSLPILLDLDSPQE